MNANMYYDKSRFIRRAKSKHARIVVLHGVTRREAPAINNNSAHLLCPNLTFPKNKLNPPEFAIPARLTSVSSACRKIPPPEAASSLRHRRHGSIAA